MDENLKWKEHFKSLKGKVASGLSALKKLKHILPQFKLREVYHALRWLKVTSDRGMLSGGSLPNTKLQTFQRLQERAFKIIKNAKRKDPWNSDWLSVDQIISFDRSIMTHKIVNKQCPESLWNKYNQRIEISSYTTGNNRNLNIQKFKALKPWNEIPIELRKIPSLYQFKRKLKANLKSSGNPN